MFGFVPSTRWTFSISFVNNNVLIKSNGDVVWYFFLTQEDQLAREFELLCLLFLPTQIQSSFLAVTTSFSEKM